jgi:hypothetical protein
MNMSPYPDGMTGDELPGVLSDSDNMVYEVVVPLVIRITGLYGDIDSPEDIAMDTVQKIIYGAKWAESIEDITIDQRDVYVALEEVSEP